MIERCFHRLKQWVAIRYNKRPDRYVAGTTPSALSSGSTNDQLEESIQGETAPGGNSPSFSERPW
ncbi:hypothetical protein [Streptomyces sp. NPDC085529]|uniref:hypothetical protein n=1 Tax=Streptomyces sp. NPDC085529 TaxID=3365729 RepID=UPI0037D150AA